jgi:hypothetical protein
VWQEVLVFELRVGQEVVLEISVWACRTYFPFRAHLLALCLGEKRIFLRELLLAFLADAYCKDLR